MPTEYYKIKVTSKSPRVRRYLQAYLQVMHKQNIEDLYFLDVTEHTLEEDVTEARTYASFEGDAV